MHRLFSLAPFCLLLVAGMSRADDRKNRTEEGPPQTLARTLTLPSAEVIDAILPGTVLDVAPFPGGGVAVLTGPEGSKNEDGESPEGPRSLYRLRGADTDLVPVATDLPAGLNAAAGRGDFLWLGEEGTLHRFLPETGRLFPWWRREGISLGSLKSRGLLPADPTAPILVSEVGGWLRLTDRDGQAAVEASGDLPVQVRRRSGGFELRSPAIERVESGILGTAPESMGSFRFRAYAVRPEASIEEYWFRFADPEEIQQHRWLEIDGRLALAVVTVPGDKVGIFQKLDLRLFYPGADRTRAGRRPTLSVPTVSRRWYSVGLFAHDADDDGHDDLVVIQLEGMGGKDLVVDIYPGKGNGRFEDRRPRRTKLKDRGGRVRFGPDFDGDGRPDLAVVSGGRLSLWSLDPAGKRRALREEPFFTLDRSTEGEGSTEVTVTVGGGDSGAEVETISARGRIHAFDISGDGRPDVVLARNVRGRAVIRAVVLDPG